MFLAQTHSNTDAQTNLYDKKSSESAAENWEMGKDHRYPPFYIMIYIRLNTFIIMCTCI